MSVRLAARRLALSGSSSPSPSSLLVASPTCAALLASPPNSSQRRHKWSINVFKGWGKSSSKEGSASRGGGSDPLTSELDDPKKRQQFLERNMHGTVEDNIFQDEIEAGPSGAAQEERTGAAQAEQKTRENMAMVTDPDPRARIRWHRKR
ncbi:hypothetical protein ACCO45_012974 [Purpureocillium lilacinum]|uniref:Uncharacterized protein n=1 Tax=Purpureocillium lilacinum TaxID=33203 RepID=A0ACC4D9W8_PURLI